MIIFRCLIRAVDRLAVSPLSVLLDVLEFRIRCCRLCPANQSLIDGAYRHLLQAITDGTLLPGQRIRQAELADGLGVSRQPVSHALQLLKRQGLVEEAGAKGLRVVPLDRQRVMQLYQVREAS